MNYTGPVLNEVLAAHYRAITAMTRDEKIRCGAYVYFSFLRPFALEAGIADARARALHPTDDVGGVVGVAGDERLVHLDQPGHDEDLRIAGRAGKAQVQRAIQRELQDPLALRILSGQFHEGDTIRVERSPEGLTFTAVAAAEPVAA